MTRRSAFFLPLLLLLGAWDPITRKQPDVARGNAALGEGKAKEAEEHYQRAVTDLGPLPGLLYNLGAAHYQAAQALPAGPDRKQLLEAAEKELRLAGDAPDTGLRASAHYNLGNTLFAQEKYKDAVDEYKKTLRLDPGRDDARHNLELALLRVPPPPPPDKKPQQSQGGKDEQKPQAGQAPEPAPPPGDAGEPRKPEEQPGKSPEDKKSDASPPPGDAQKDTPQAGQEQKGQEPRPDDAKPDEPKQQPARSGAETGDRDTDRKLDLLEDFSKNLQVQKAQQRARERRRGAPVKDW